MKKIENEHLIDKLFFSRADYMGILITGTPTDSMFKLITEVINKDELV